MIRLGLIVPSSNTTIESEFFRMLSSSRAKLSVHSARVRLHSVTVDGLAQMEEKVEEEAAKLGDALVDAIAYGCTSGSLIKGPGHDKAIVEKIERASGKPGIATAGAVVDALKTFKVKKVVVATPYIAEINKLEEAFLQAHGFDVLDLEGLELNDNIKIGTVKSKRVIELVRDLKHETADGIFISCTNLPTIRVINKLEGELGKPVISSNTATLWALLRKCAPSTKIRGYGKLLY